MFDIFKKKEGPKALAKKAYESAVRLSGDAKAVRAVKVRVALRATHVIDAIFEDGVRSVLGYDEDVMIAVAGGEDPPSFPKASADTCYKKIETPEGKAVGYIPFKYADPIFSLGVQYQSRKISADQAFQTAQQVAQHMASELKLSAYSVQPIEPLSWLRRDS
ncbi:MAG: hypothetical protein NWS83_00315 [Burkholderiaceae bacterium]|nr:hypothetical protein [Burkholderiaceae bacterium]